MQIQSGGRGVVGGVVQVALLLRVCNRFESYIKTESGAQIGRVKERESVRERELGRKAIWQFVMDSRKKVRLTDLGAHKICRQVKQRMSNKSNGYLMMATLAPLSTATSTPTVNWPPSGAAGAIKFKQTKGREAVYSVFCVTSESFGACQN